MSGTRYAFQRRAISWPNRIGRWLWGITWILLFRPSPVIFHGWRRVLLRLFGATVGRCAHAYPSVRIWAPWNLKMADGSCLAPHVDCYCVDKVELGVHATVSQYSFLCTASRDSRRRSLPLISAPIVIGKDAWIAADVFVGPGVSIGEGAIVGARSTVLRDVPPWVLAAGNPAKVVRTRSIEDQDHAS